MFIRLIVVYFAVALIWLLIVPASPVGAQIVSGNYPNPQVHLKPSVLEHFDIVLPALARQGRVAIVCEGQPLHLKLTADQTQELAQRINPNGMPLEDAVKWVAAAYDYRAQRTGADIFVLTKRYTYTDDLPDVPFEEANASLQNILKATADFFPKLDTADSILAMLRASTPEQRAKLAQGVSVLSLDEDQRAAIVSMVKSIAFRPLFSVGRIAQRLEGIQKPSTVFTYSQFFGLTLPICEGPLGPDGADYSVVLSGWVQTQPGESGGEPAGGKLVNDKLVPNQPGDIDPTTPLPLDQSPMPAVSVFRHTLEEEAQQSTERLAKDHILLTIHVDPILASKTACLVGETNATPAEIMTALASVYGLELNSDAHTETLVMDKPTIINDAQSIPAEVKRLLPSPFMRKVEALDAEEGFPNEKSPVTPNFMGVFASKSGDKNFSILRASTLYIAAVRRLRQHIEPQMKAMPSQKLPVSDTDAEVHSCFALASMATCLLDFYNLVQPSTSYVSNFDKATLTLNQDKGDPTQIGFVVDAPDGNGGGTGVSGQVGWTEFRQYAP